MVAVIIAGGKGTRLGLTDTPKCLVKIAGVPLLKRQIETLKKYGIKKFYILSGHLAEKIKAYAGNGDKFSVSITHITEEWPMGTAGCLKLLEGTIKHRFMVVYGDIIFDMNIKKLLAFDEKVRGMVTIVAHPNSHPHDSDLIEINHNKEIIAVHPKPHGPIYHTNMVNSGIYIFSPAIFPEIPLWKTSDIGKNIIPRIASVARVHAYVTPEYIMDVGTPERIVKARRDMKSGKISRLNIENKRRAIFLDRDGVINTLVDNLSNADKFELLPGAAEAIKSINKSEYLAIVVTNQPAISKGMMTADDLQTIHKKMDYLLGAEGTYIDALHYCPHHPDSGYKGEVAELKIECKCRKPKPGMLLRAAREMNIDLKNSWIIGDSPCDISAGKAAGCQTVAVGNRANNGSKYYAKNLKDAVKLIMGVS